MTVLRVDDARLRPDPALDERDMLIAFLDLYRETIAVKLDGLDGEGASRRLVPSQTTLLGILKHLTLVEIWWFQVDFAGNPQPFAVEDEQEWRVEDGDDPAAILAEYRAAWAESNRITREAPSLDERARGEGRSHLTLRWILAHMVEETARHAGHADILRELTDGRTGD